VGVFRDFISGIYQINIYVIHLLKVTHYDTVFFIIAGVINSVLNYFLIQFIGLDGVAISTFVSYLFLALIISLLAQKN